MKEHKIDDKITNNDEGSEINSSQNEILEDTLHNMTETLNQQLNEKESEISDLKKEINELKTKANNYLNTASYYKSQAESNKQDFDRFKERNKNIEVDAVNKANHNVAKKIIPILDNFHSAMEVLEPEIMKGFIMIYSSLCSTLRELGVSEISPNGEVLDPEKHNCIDTTLTDDKSLDGTIAKTYQKGYWFESTNQIIRPASVSVYKLGE